MIGVTPSGTEISTRPFQLVTDWVWKGSAFVAARGRTDPPKIVDIDDLSTLTTPLDKISDAFELCAGAS
jgi:S-(hydroxymethyl)glutathione dehydrogenase/alcohol dehydrogenase